MYFLIRKQSAHGSAESLDTEYQLDQLTLGEDADAVVQLSGVAGRVTIDCSAGAWQISVRKTVATLNGEPVKKGQLRLGDVLDLPGHSLTVIEAPAGFDLALRLISEDAGTGQYGPGLELSGSAWGVRKTSWLLALLVLVSCLLIPLSGLYRVELADQLRQSLLPDDGLWSTGPLAAAHLASGIAEDCQACHRSPFVMVEDAACLECHRDTREHVDLARGDAPRFSR